MRTWYVWIPLWLVYLALSGNLELPNLLAGLVIAWLVTALLRPRPRDIPLRRLPQALYAVLRYFLLLIYDLVISGFQVARIVLDPDLPISPGIIAIPTETQSEPAVALSAHAISVTPGELVIEIDEQGVMYTHTLDATQKSAQIQEAQQVRETLLEKITR